ncbi:MAG TPA: aldehyde reductase [Hyphomonadaceae bacterium]|nr:aldehyde reductase [Hyphomonadaceae bacterium]HPN05472.1 aldehyde reductase [Hyphomonadaceae bacterium]
MARVLVTGASGFVAQHVILKLLAKGYQVRGTLRSLKRADEVRAVLVAYDARAKAIEFVEADLSSADGWDAAAKDCALVQHVASPFPATFPKDEMELIRPARDGAIRVLRAAKKAGVKRVVLTSSMAAIAYGHGDKRAEVSDETMWSDIHGPDNTPYTKSKTIAEQAAWDYVKGHSHNGEGLGLELTTINPTGILGPALSKDVSTSLEIPIRLLNGKTPGVPRIGFSIVDVRDVAECHVKAMELPGAAGERFLAAADFMWFADAAEILRKAFPAYDAKIPKRQIPDFVLKLMAVFQPVYKQIVTELGRTRNASNAKATRILGVNFRSGEEALISAAKTLIDLKVV